jgi:hypothetical protein
VPDRAAGRSDDHRPDAAPEASPAAARAAGAGREWLVPEQLAATVLELVATADRIDDPALALVWTDHLPVAVLAVIERRGFRRRLSDGDVFLAG